MFQVERVVSYLKGSVGTHRITDSAYKAIVRAGKPITMALGQVVNGSRLVNIDGIDESVTLAIVNDGRDIYIDEFKDCGFCL